MEWKPMALQYKHIFIVTYGRSGSTLLSGLLNAIPGVCVRGENANVLPLLAMAVDAAALAHSMGSEADLPDRAWYGSSRIAPEDFQQKLVAAFLEDVIRPPAGAVAVGFKEIRHCVRHMSDRQYDSYIEFLLGAFEQPCIIFNVRSPKEVARSAFWKSDPFAKRHIRQCETRFRRSLGKHPRSTFLVDYDQYVRDPDMLRGLFDFLGVQFDRAVVDPVLARRHGYQDPAFGSERLAAMRFTAIEFLEALIRWLRR